MNEISNVFTRNFVKFCTYVIYSKHILPKRDPQVSLFLKHHKLHNFCHTFWVILAKVVPLRIIFNVKGSTIGSNKFNSFGHQFFIFSEIGSLDNVKKIFLGDGSAKIFLTELFQRSNFIFVSLNVFKSNR